MNLVHTCLFHKVFCTLYFGSREKNMVTLPQSAQRKHAFLGEIKEMSKSKKLPSRKKIALEFLHQRLGHIYIISFLAGNTTNVWMDIELITYPDPFCRSCQISLMKKKDRSKNQLNPKASFKWVLMYIIPPTTPRSLTSDTTFSNYLLIVNT